MEQLEYKTDLIEVSVSGTFKTVHVFNTPDGILGTLSIKGSKGEGKFVAADESALDFRKPSIWKNQYELLDGTSRIGQAHPPKALKRAFEIDLDGDIFHLVPGGSKLRSWTLKDNQGRGICEFLTRGGIKRGAYIRIGAEISLQLLIFGYCLVLRRWHEESTSAAI